MVEKEEINDIVKSVEDQISSGQTADTVFNGVEGFVAGRAVNIIATSSSTTVGALVAEQGLGKVIARAAGGPIGIGVQALLGSVDTKKYANYGQNVDATGAAVGTGGLIGGAAAGSIAGGWAAGAIAGATAGSVLPGIGTIVVGVAGGLIGWWAGNKIGKVGAKAVGAKNKYTAVLSLEDVEEIHRDGLVSQGINLEEMGEEAIKIDLARNIAALQDKGYAIVNDTKSNFFADQVGATDLVKQSYADFDETASLAALRDNLQTFAMKDGSIREERFAGYKRRFEDQINALVASGELTLEIQNDLMTKISTANIGFKDGQTREELFAKSLEKIEIVGAESAANSPAVSTPQISPQPTPVKIDTDNVNHQSPILQGPKPERQDMMTNIMDWIKDLLVGLPLIGGLFKMMFESETPVIPIASHRTEIRSESNPDSSEVALEGEDLAEVAALGSKIGGAAKKGRNLRDSGEITPGRGNNGRGTDGVA